jgi:ATP-binding cassette subfamily F protein 3
LPRSTQLIQINNLSKSYGGQEVISDVTLSLMPRERVGLVGRNGSGKSTLFRIILGEELPDLGDVVIPKGYKLGSLSQHIEFNHKNVLEECCSALPKGEEHNVYKAEKYLMGLGFSQEDFLRPPSEFSGGFQLRINLIKALLQEPNLLLLDEPTNYLDIISLRWLRGFLRTFPGEIILITHDRDFMDEVSTHTMGINRGTIKKISGGTQKFYEQMIMEDEIYEQTRQNMEKKKKHLQSFVDRFRAKASKATQAQSKLKQLDKLGTIEKLDNDKNFGFSFNYKDIPSKTVLEAEDLSFSYGSDFPTLFEDVSISLKKGERLAIIGKNGKGKSTLLNVLGNELKSQSGNIRFHKDAEVSHFGQTNIQRLSMKATVAEEIGSANDALTRTAVRNICGAMMFEGDLADKKISVLSGGERSRVLLGKILANKSTVLLLDEPTNHLDMESVEILIDEIDSFPGSVIFVTHSEFMLKQLATKLVVFQDGKAAIFDGTYDEFLEKIGWDEIEDDVEKNPKKKLSKKDSKRLRAELTLERSKKAGPFKKQVEKLEEDISNAENRIKEIEEELVAASENSNGDIVSTLSKELGALNKNIESWFDELEIASEKMEAISSEFDQRLEDLS